MPVFIIISVIPLSQGGGDIDISAFFNADFTDPVLVSWVFVGAAAAGLFLSGMCMVTSTAISREGPLFFVMKYIPVSYRTQLNAKAFVGLVLNIAALLLTAIVIQVFVMAPAHIFAGVLALMMPGAVLLNYLGLFIDLAKPKLNWENEQAAVKQNINVMFVMLAGIVLALLLVLLGMVLHRLASPLASFLITGALMTVLAVAGYHFVLNTGEEMMAKLSN
jgi:ABC-2 type transport system permease protein